MALLSEPAQFVLQVWKIDRVVLAIAVVSVILIVLVPEQTWESAIFTGEALVGIGPLLIMSVSVAAFAKATGLDKQIAIAFFWPSGAGGVLCGGIRRALATLFLWGGSDHRRVAGGRGTVGTGNGVLARLAVDGPTDVFPDDPGLRAALHHFQASRRFWDRRGRRYRHPSVRPPTSLRRPDVTERGGL